MPSCREHGDHLLRDLSLGMSILNTLYRKMASSFFSSGEVRRGTCTTIKTAVRHEDVGVRIISQKIAEGLHGDDGAGDGSFPRIPDLGQA
jgi:hypothetical protein